MSTKNKRIVIAAVVIVALLAAGAGYAYWTTTGSGSGSAAAGTTGTPLTLAASFPTGITPGATRTVSFTATNPNTSSTTVVKVHLAGVTFDAGHSACLAADFTMPDVTQNFPLAAGATNVALPNTGTLTFADTAVNQDACKGATITLNLTS